MTFPAGLLLLTGGRGQRFGAPKHAQPHPRGGTWGSHLVDVFLEIFPDCPVRILGEPLPDLPGFSVIPDAGQGPAAALIHWATLEKVATLRWWVVACDQVRWTAASLATWHDLAGVADPEANQWVMARAKDHAQYLGSFLAGNLVPRLPGLAAPSLRELAGALPCQVLDWSNDCWMDVDTPEALKTWQDQ